MHSFETRKNDFRASLGTRIIPQAVVRDEVPQKYFKEIIRSANITGIKIPEELALILAEMGYTLNWNGQGIESVRFNRALPPNQVTHIEVPGREMPHAYANKRPARKYNSGAGDELGDHMADED